jgi:hypothetical protein
MAALCDSTFEQHITQLSHVHTAVHIHTKQSSLQTLHHRFIAHWYTFQKKKKVSFPILIAVLRSHHNHHLLQVLDYLIILKIPFQDGGNSGDDGHSILRFYAAHLCCKVYGNRKGGWIF